MRFVIGTTVAVLAAALLAGCAVNWKVHRLTPTPQNLQAYRECQRTFATALRLDIETKKACLGTLEWTSEMVSAPSVPQAPPGCQRLDWHYYEVYLLCK